MKIEIYSKDNCPYCDMAINLSENTEGVVSSVFKLDTDFTREELFEKFPNARTFPQITIDGESIGGYDNLVKYLEK